MIFVIIAIESPKIYQKPVLGYVNVGNLGNSNLYMRLKLNVCEELGIEPMG